MADEDAPSASNPCLSCGPESRYLSIDLGSAGPWGRSTHYAVDEITASELISGKFYRAPRRKVPEYALIYRIMGDPYGDSEPEPEPEDNENFARTGVRRVFCKVHEDQYDNRRRRPQRYCSCEPAKWDQLDRETYALIIYSHQRAGVDLPTCIGAAPPPLQLSPAS